MKYVIVGHWSVIMPRCLLVSLKFLPILDCAADHAMTKAIHSSLLMNRP